MSELNCYLSKVALLPEWAKQFSFNLIGAYVVLGLLKIIIKRLREPDFKLTVVFLKVGEDLHKSEHLLTQLNRALS